MSVYVDDMQAPFRGMIMCHMFADSDAELNAFARQLGLKFAWKHKEHFDISQSKKAEAIKLGAIEITQHEMAKKIAVVRGQSDLFEGGK